MILLPLSSKGQNWAFSYVHIYLWQQDFEVVSERVLNNLYKEDILS